MQMIYSWTFEIKIGNNTLLLPAPVTVNQGNYILLTQGTGKIAVDISGNATYSDLVWNTTTQWTKLAEFSNWRFYLTTINNFTSYTNTLNVLHSYANIGLYTLSLTFLSSNKTFQQIVNITDCNFFLIIIFISKNIY
jgi:hypothetical protein